LPIVIYSGGPDFPFEQYGPRVELGPMPWHYATIPKKIGFPLSPELPALMDADGKLDNLSTFDIKIVSILL
jgi:hypothetical protein